MSQPLTATHIAKSHQSTRKPKLGKEYGFFPTADEQTKRKNNEGTTMYKRKRNIKASASARQLF